MEALVLYSLMGISVHKMVTKVLQTLLIYAYRYMYSLQLKLHKKPCLAECAWTLYHDAMMNPVH